MTQLLVDLDLPAQRRVNFRIRNRLLCYFLYGDHYAGGFVQCELDSAVGTLAYLFRLEFQVAQTYIRKHFLLSHRVRRH